MPAPFVEILKKRPTRIFAIDSMGKRRRLPSRDLRQIYQMLEAHERETQAAPASVPYGRAANAA